MKCEQLKYQKLHIAGVFDNAQKDKRTKIGMGWKVGTVVVTGKLILHLAQYLSQG